MGEPPPKPVARTMWDTENWRRSPSRKIVTFHFLVEGSNFVVLGSSVALHQALISNTSTYDSRKFASLPAGVKMGQLEGKGKKGR